MTLIIPYPYTFINGVGHIIDADQMNANFAEIATVFGLALTEAAPAITGTPNVAGWTEGVVIVNGAGAMESGNSLSQAVLTAASLRSFNQYGWIGLSRGIVTITPQATGRVLVVCCGSVAGTTSLLTVNASLVYGPGAEFPSSPAPSPNPATGLTVPTDISYQGNSAGGFQLAAAVSGLTIGQGYWFDVAISGGASGPNLNNLQLSVVEL